MLDKILGSDKDKTEKKLEKKEREVETLKKNLKKTKKELEKEEKRAKEAITKKQNTDKKLKDAKHKIETLKDKINRLEEESGEKSEKKVRILTKSETLEFLNELKGIKSEEETLVTHYFDTPDDSGKDEVVRKLKGSKSETGYVHLQDKFNVINCILTPPFPTEPEFYRGERFKLEKIHDIFKSDVQVGFISVHAGKSAVGILDRRGFREFKIVRSKVSGKHSKGGFSQGRFQRGRDEQIQEHLKDLLNIFHDLVTNPDYIVLEGNNRMITDLKDEIRVESPMITKSLDIGEVKEGKKEEYAEKIWGSRLYIL